MLIDKSLQYSGTLQFSLKARQLKEQGREIISLGLGEPEFDTPEHIKQAAKEALDAGLTRYSSPAGLGELRDLVAAKLREDNDINAQAGEVLITPGAKNALFLACAALLRPGDEVINFTPCYVSNGPIIKLAEPKCVVHDVPLTGDDFRIDPDRIRSCINDRTRLIFINYPNNPTGVMMTPDEAQFLRDVVAAGDFYLLSDEIYERIVFGDMRHISPASFEDIRERVVTVNGFSKTYAMTGWRIGYVHANSELTTLMTKIHQQINTNTAAFIQKAAVAALTGPQNHIGEFVEKLRRRKLLYDDMVAGNEHLTGSSPDGGFFGFMNVSATGLTSDEFCAKLLDETGVAVIPGVQMGERFDRYARVSLVNQTDVVAEGLKRISDFVNEIVRST